MFDTVLDALAEVTGCDRDALNDLVGSARQPAELSPAMLVRRISAHERLADAVQASQAHDLAAFGAARQAADRADGCGPLLEGRTAGIEIAAALAVATLTAQCRLHAAGRAVHDHPRLLSLVGTGRLSMAGLRRALAATDVLEPDLRRRVDGQLGADASRSRLTPGQLAKAAERRVLAADPEAAAKRAAAARRARSVRMGDPHDGVAGVYATLRAEEAWAAHQVLDRTARGMRQQGDPRDLDTLRADLFVEWITGSPTAPDQSAAPSTWRSREGWDPWTWSDPPPPVADPDPDPCEAAWDDLAEPATTPPTPPTPPESAVDPPQALQRRLPADVEVQVVISAATLLGLDNEPGLLRGYGAVPATVVRDIVDGADRAGARTVLRGLFADPVDGRLVAMDSSARFFAGGLRQFVLARDQSCRFGGGQIVDVDHVIDRHRGGPTTAANGQSLGKLAHVLKDHPGISVTTLPPVAVGDGLDHLRAHAPDVEWTLPTGDTRINSPPPVLGPGSHLVETISHAGEEPSSLLERQLRGLLAAAR